MSKLENKAATKRIHSPKCFNRRGRGIYPPMSSVLELAEGLQDTATSLRELVEATPIRPTLEDLAQGLDWLDHRITYLKMNIDDLEAARSRITAEKTRRVDESASRVLAEES